MFIRIHPENPQERLIKQIVGILNNDGVIITPTDTVYAIACSAYRHKAIEKVARIKGVKLEKAHFSFLCPDLSVLSEYTKPINNELFRLMKRTLPGPYTYILKAGNKVPKILESNKKTIGIRVPDNTILQSILTELGEPLMTTSLHTDDDDYFEYVIDAELIYEKYENSVDVVIDGGTGGIVPSTVIDASSDELILVREGLGSIEDFDFE